MTAVLRIDGLAKKYGNTFALRPLSLEIELGQVFGLLGPNGSGKTTTLGIVLGAIRATQGRYSWFGQGNSSFLRQRIGALLEAPCFYPWFSGEHNLRIVATVRGVPRSQAAVERCLRTVGLWDHRRERFGIYSLGMKQRLAIAGTLLGDPEVLVLDEPANGVDAEGIAEIRRLIIDLGVQKRTVILASHILDEVEKVCTHIGILRSGELVEMGAIADVLQTPDVIEVAAEDMSILETTLRRFPACTDLQRNGSCFKVKVNEATTTADLNRFLIANTVVVTHLAQKKSTLESHFLHLMERS